MIVDWVYGNPTWLWGSTLVVIVTATACAGLVLFHRVVHLNVRRQHNDLAGFTFAIIGVLYAVLVAFIAIATWESFSKASDIVENESDYAGGMYLITSGLPDEPGQKVRDSLAKYVNVVINDEWPIQRRGVTPDQGWKPLREIAIAVAAIHPHTPGEAVIEAQLLRTWNDLYVARSSRLSAVQGHVPDIVWSIVFLGAAITITYTYLFGFESFRMHMAMTAIVAATLALVIVMIIALDWPFRGEISVSPEPFVETLKSWDLAPSTPTGPRG
jgi:hypothetical protein